MLTGAVGRAGAAETGGLATVNTSLNNTASIDQERASELLTEVRTCPQSVRIINFNQPISRTHKRLMMTSLGFQVQALKILMFCYLNSL